MNKYTVITLNKKNITDFAKERNELLKKAKNEWILFLDTDEAVSEGLDKEIKKQIEENKYNGFYIDRKNYFLGSYIGTDKILRLGRKNTGKWVRSVHEIWNIKGKTGKLKNPIIHNSASSLYEVIAKINTYSTLHAEANKLEGKKANLFKIIFYPKLKFIQSLFMSRGVVFSILQAFHSYLSWSKIWISQKD